VYGTLKAWKPEERIRFANACGALANTKIGAISSLPWQAEVEQFLLTRKEVGDGNDPS